MLNDNPRSPSPCVRLIGCLSLAAILAVPLALAQSGFTAVDDSVGIRAGEIAIIDVLANDTGTGLFIAGTPSPPANGSTAILFDEGLSREVIEYTPNPGFTGEDSFTYEIFDSSQSRGVTGSIATVRIRVGVSSVSGLGSNEQGVADTVDGICGDPDLSNDPVATALCAEIQSLSDSDADAALEDITPEELAGQGTSLVEATQTQQGNVRSRLTALRGGSIGMVQVSGLMIALGSETIPVGSMAESLYAAPNAQADDGTTEIVGGRLGFFLNGRVAFGEQESTSNETGFDFDTLGLTAGVDYRFSDQFVFGGALGYSSNETEFTGGAGDTESDMLMLSAYGNYYPVPRGYIDFILSYADSEFDTRRNLEVGSIETVARGTTDGEEVAVSVSGGYDLYAGGVTFTPYGRIDYLTADIDGYTETGGAGLALVVDDQEIESLRTTGAVQIGRSFSFPWGVLTPAGRFEYEYEHDNDARMLTSSFALSPSDTFVITTDAPDRSFLNLAVSLVATLKQGRSAFVDFETVEQAEGFDSYTFNFGFRMEF